MKTIQRIIDFLKYWFWKRPVSEPEPLRATEVSHNYTVITYSGQQINLLKTEVPAFYAMSRKDKRAMALRFKTMQKKGSIRFEEINGKVIAIKNKDYAEQANIRQLRDGKVRQGK